MSGSDGAAVATTSARKAPRGEPRSAHKLVSQGIGRAIVSGEFPVGFTLPNKEVLMRRFGVSNTSLREALQTLTAKGLLAAKTKVGFWVLDESHWNMFDADILTWRLEVGVDKTFLAKLFEMRQALEPLAAAVAALRHTDDHLARLRQWADEMARAGQDKKRFTDADVAFHLCVLEASCNPFMQSIGALISAALAASFALSAPTDDADVAAIAHREHLAIVEAIASRDGQAAADAMAEVIRTGWANADGQDTKPLAALALEDFSTPLQLPS
jgi:DNA-binding FadR family transcriptional regulator